MPIVFQLLPNKSTGSSFSPDEFNTLISTLTALAAAYSMANIPTPASLGLFPSKSSGQKMTATEFNNMVNLLGQLVTAANGNGTSTPTALVVGLTTSAASTTTGTALTFTASASGGTGPYTYLTQATNTATGTTINIGSAATGSWTPQAAGSFELTTTVTDSAGAVKISPVRTVTVSAAPVANQLPVANAGADNTVQIASGQTTASFQLQGSGTDADGSVQSYSWQKSTSLAATLSSTTVASPTVSGAVAGTHRFSLVVTDNQGGVSLADEVVVTVQAASSGGITEYTPADSNWFDTAAPVLESGQYPQRESQAQLPFTTSATSVEVQYYNGLASMGYPNATLEYYVNGVLKTVAASGAGPQWVALPSLPAGQKTITLLAGGPAKSGGSGPILSGDIINIRANSTVTYQTATAPATRYVVAGDSITNGGNAGLVAYGWTMLLRKRLQDAGLGRLSLHGVSADSMTEVYGPGADRAAFRNRLLALADGTSSNTLILAYGTNDRGLNKATAADFGSYYEQLVDDLHAARPTLTIVSLTPIVRTDGVDLTDYRAAITALGSSRSWLKIIDGPAMMTNSGLSNDNLHPSMAGHATLEHNIWAALNNTVAPPNTSATEPVTPALTFVGGDCFIKLPAISGIKTIAFWYRREALPASSTGVNQVFADGSISGTNYGYLDHAEGNIGFAAVYSNGQQLAFTATHGLDEIATGQWRKVVLRLPTSAASASVSMVLLGRAVPFNNQLYSAGGQITDIRLYSDDWTTQELADKTVGFPTDNILASYDFVGVSSTAQVLPDTSGNGRNATMLTGQ